MLLGPAHGQPAVLAHLAHGLAVQRAAFGATQGQTQRGRHQGVEIVAHAQAQGVLFGAQVDEHGDYSYSWPKISPLVGTPVPAVTSTLRTWPTWLTAVPRTWRTASAMPFMPWI